MCFRKKREKVRVKILDKICEGYVFTGVCLSTRGGHVWLLPGGCMVAPGGHAWLLLGGVHGCCQGGMHGCSGGVRGCCQGGVCGCSWGWHAWLLQGACMVAPWGCGCSWGPCVVAARVVCVGYEEIWRYDQWAGSTHPTGMHSCYH